MSPFCAGRKGSMGKSLVIVESPAKAKTINKYLGADYVVKSSVGHIRDLATARKTRASGPTQAGGKLSPAQKAKQRERNNREQLVRRMGIDPQRGWKAHYEILPAKEKVVSELKKFASNADTIYLATDLDREGEAIAWHLREAIGGAPERYKRVVFNEITRRAIEQAFAEPGELDVARVNAQQARRFLDRVVGFMVSPLLWAKIARGLSAGRVQSVAVRLIVEREREIHAFVPEEFWELHADLKPAAADAVRFQLRRQGAANFRPDNRDDALRAVAELERAHYVVEQREDKPTRSRAPAPFITSTLQQAASTRLGFSVKKIMMLAQRLYEAGYITYMRTDSTNLSADAINDCRRYIEGNYPAAYLPGEANRYSSKAGAQEAHEAIRPSDVTLAPTALRGMERDTERLYELIWRQFVACQMTPARYLSSTVTVRAGVWELTARGRIIEFDGYTRVQPVAGKRAGDVVLPAMQPGDVLQLLQLQPSQHFTKPAPRYGEASLVRELEKRGIGRPSTYASIISTIQERGYVRLENKRFYGEKMGDIVTERLQNSFPNLLDYGFTAAMEGQLDDIAQGKLEWKQLLDQFYKDFVARLRKAEGDRDGMRRNEPSVTEIRCPRCQRPMHIRTASTGVFLGCSGYALPPAERCKSTMNLISGDEAIGEDADEEAESRQLRHRHRCRKCNTAMDSYLIDEKRKLHVCGKNPDCDGHDVEQGVFRIKGYDGPLIECDKCGADMQLKSGRFGKYFACSDDSCKNTRKLLRSGEAAPPRMAPVPMPELACHKVEDTYVLRDGAAGLFLAASQYPRNRETRAPFVDEILQHQQEIDAKYQFLFSAPVTDDAGHRTQIRYSRKTKEQYLMTENDGKATGWRAVYSGGAWVAQQGGSARKSSARKSSSRKSSPRKSSSGSKGSGKGRAG